MKIGNGVYINHYSIIDCHYSITIGDGVNIGPHCYIGDFDHDITLNANSTAIKSDGIALPVIIKNNVWLGAGVIVLKGVTIGEGAIVGGGVLLLKIFHLMLYLQVILLNLSNHVATYPIPNYQTK